MADLSDDKFMLLYGEIKAVGKELTTLKDERIQRMQDDIAGLRVRMSIVYAVCGLVAAGLVTYFLTQWQTLTAPH